MTSSKISSSVVSVRSARRSKSYTAAELEAFKNEVDYDDHIITIEELCIRYATDINYGLNDHQAESLLKTNGPNALTPPAKVPEWLIFVKFLYKGFASLLWIAAALCMTVHFVEKSMHEDASDEHFYLSCILILVIFITSIFSYVQERKTSKIMEAFKKMVPPHTVVIRSGVKVSIPAEDVVLGDLIYLRTGDRIPADLRIVETEGLKVDNSTLTGESEPLKRTTQFTSPNPMETGNLAFFSTMVSEGTGKGVVIACGDCTVMGRVAGLASGMKTEQTPIAKEIKRFMNIIIIYSVCVGTFVFVLSVASGYTIMESVIYLLAILISSVPEGMLVTITMCLSISAKRMADRQCLVKNMEAVETLGSTSLICSDKTGTITLNRMSVSHVYVNSQILDTNSTQDHPDHELIDTSNESFKALWFIVALNSRAEFHPEDENLEIENRRVMGDASECALLKYAEMSLGNVMEFRKKFEKLAEIPFSSKWKYQVSVHKMSEGVERFIVLMKGAPERVIDCCDTALFSGKDVKIEKALVDKILDACYQLAVLGERVIGFCDKVLPEKQFPAGFKFDSEKVNFPTNHMRFIGLISLIDPPRKTVAPAVAICRAAGIRVMMITGDHPATARAIAKEVNIISEGSETVDDISKRENIPMSEVDITAAKAAVITGDILRNMSREDLSEILKMHEESVFARTSPTQKLMIVETCQKMGYIVAVTGDGVNDSPAMKQASIGIAMGITGTDVAKNSADMILLDDNFATIVVGVEEGRRIFDNLKKSVAFTLTANTPEILPFIASIAFNIPLPLGIIAIICINYVTDLWPSISLVYEKAETDIMKRAPRDPKNDKLINSRMLLMTYVQIGSMQAAAGFFCYFYIMAEHGFFPSRLFGLRQEWNSKNVNDLEDSFGQEWTYDERKELEYTCHTAFFAAIFIVQTADVIICKTRRLSLLQQGMTNWPLNWGIVIQTIIAVGIIYIPKVDTILHFYPLKWYWWFLSFPYFFLIIFYDEVRRYLIRRHPNGWVAKETYY
ncbi:Sodium/potassium-transporting ATPase subunit alpha [Blattella germanica]|nr:Sodium/potassium-transporting ATPase subunit alpha [Blattella germanica]